MSPPIRYKLVYFEGMGKAEVIKMIFFLHKTAFEDRRINFEEWKIMKKDLPFCNLPVLYINGSDTLHTSGAILRYLATKFNLNGKNMVESAYIDMYTNLLTDSYSKLPFLEADVKVKVEKIVKIHTATILPILQKLEENLRNKNSRFLVGDKISYVDLKLANCLLITQQYLPSLLRHVPLLDGLKSFVLDMEEMEQYKQTTSLFL